MSIIQEALKRAQKSYAGNNTPPRVHEEQKSEPRQEPVQEINQEPKQEENQAAKQESKQEIKLKPVASPAKKSSGAFMKFIKMMVIIGVISLLVVVTGNGIREMYLNMVLADREKRLNETTASHQTDTEQPDQKAEQKTVPDKPVQNIDDSDAAKRSDSGSNKDVPLTAAAASDRSAEKQSASSPSLQKGYPPHLILNGIMYTEENPKAIINGTPVGKGDVIGGAIVTSVTENNVMLKYNNGSNQVELMLKLKE
jgi:hypothetical protein